MDLLFILIAVLFIGKWIIESVVMGLFKGDAYEEIEHKEPPTIIHNHYTENHLHVNEKEYERLKNNS